MRLVDWRPPNPGIIKINVDLALPCGQAFFRIGLVARDSSGGCVWWVSKQFSRRPAPVDGEAMAVLHGILLARDKQWSHVVIAKDCLQVFRSLSHDSSSSSSFGAFVEASLDSRHFFHSLSFSFIRRSGNSWPILLLLLCLWVVMRVTFFPLLCFD